MTYTFDKETFKLWEKEKETKYAIPDPNDNLIEIYEIDTIKDALLLRAEKWESPEHNNGKENLPEKKPLNVQNPNYTELLDNIRALQKQSSELKKNNKDLKQLKETPDIMGIAKKEKTIGEIENKLQASWKKFMEFTLKICKTMLATAATATEPELPILKLEFLPDIRFLHYMLTKKEPRIHLELISLICSYFHTKYVCSDILNPKT
jgi:hypothetical protein